MKKRRESNERIEGRGPVLAAVDLSPLSEETLLWADCAAERFDAPLVVLHVVHDADETAEAYAGRRGSEFRTVREIADELFRDLVGRVCGARPRLDGRLVTRLESGLPAERVVEVANEISAQLIVVGSHGHKGLPGLFRGSNARAITRRTAIPVTVVKPAR